MVEYDDIIDSIRLDEVLNELGIVVTQITKGEHWSSCPLDGHPGADATPSFSINEDNLLWNCFTCHEGGSLPMLVRDIEHFTDDDGSRSEPKFGLTAFEKGVEWLLPFSDGDVESDDGFMKQLERYLERADERPKRTRSVALPFYSPKIIERLDDAPVELLAKWNITQQETVTHHQIKFVPERHRVGAKGEYTGPALVIPHYFGGKLVGYQERWLDDDRGKYPPKYTNSDDFPKALTLYGWDDAVEEARRGTPVIVVESTMTKNRLWEIGYTAAATFGASVSDEQLRLLRSLLGGVILAFDNDPDYLNKKGETVRGSGVIALEQVADHLTDFIPVEIVPPIPQEKGDLADLLEEATHDLIRRRKPVFSALANPKRRKQRTAMGN